MTCHNGYYLCLKLVAFGMSHVDGAIDLLITVVNYIHANYQVSLTFVFHLTNIMALPRH